MARRKVAKRKPAGRKPKGEFSKLDSPFSVRLPKSMRAELDAAAKKSGRAAGQELLARLRNSFHRDRDKSRDPALRALCFLIGEMAEGVGCSAGPIRPGDLRLLWRSNPFLFRAFKLTVAKLLDALEPAGEIETPLTAEVVKSLERKYFKIPAQINDFMLRTYESPEALADYVFSITWSALRRTAPLSEEIRNQAILRELPELRSRWDDKFYGMSNARRDLQVKLEGEKS
jgi:hypothetical protein